MRSRRRGSARDRKTAAMVALMLTGIVAGLYGHLNGAHPPREEEQTAPRGSRAPGTPAVRAERVDHIDQRPAGDVRSEASRTLDVNAPPAAGEHRGGGPSGAIRVAEVFHTLPYVFGIVGSRPGRPFDWLRIQLRSMTDPIEQVRTDPSGRFRLPDGFQLYRLAWVVVDESGHLAAAHLACVGSLDASCNPLVEPHLVHAVRFDGRVRSTSRANLGGLLVALGMTGLDRRPQNFDPVLWTMTTTTESGEFDFGLLPAAASVGAEGSDERRSALHPSMLVAYDGNQLVGSTRIDPAWAESDGIHLDVR